MSTLKYIDELDIAEKRVFIRVDFNWSFPRTVFPAALAAGAG